MVGLRELIFFDNGTLYCLEFEWIAFKEVQFSLIMLLFASLLRLLLHQLRLVELIKHIAEIGIHFSHFIVKAAYYIPETTVACLNSRLFSCTVLTRLTCFIIHGGFACLCCVLAKITRSCYFGSTYIAVFLRY